MPSFANSSALVAQSPFDPTLIATGALFRATRRSTIPVYSPFLSLGAPIGASFIASATAIDHSSIIGPVAAGTLALASTVAPLRIGASAMAAIVAATAMAITLAPVVVSLGLLAAALAATLIFLCSDR